LLIFLHVFFLSLFLYIKGVLTILFFNRCVSDRFDVGRATAWRSVRRVVFALYYYLHTFIKWPSLEEAKATWTFIQMKHGFPKVIGAIDGTHVKMPHQEKVQSLI